MHFQQKYQITAKYLTAPSKRRSGQRIDGPVKFLVAHDTGNPGSTATNNVRYYENSRNDISASAHLFVDDKEILECIPALTASPEKAWHVLYNTPRDNQLFGADANDAAIGVEYCFGGHINAEEAYQRYVWVLAYLCYHFKLDPIRDVVGHYLLDPARKTDPKSGLAHSGRSYDQLLLDIRAEYQRCSPTAPSSDYQVKEQTGTVSVTSKLNIRKGAPTRLSAIVRTVAAGQKLDYVAIIADGEEVNGNPVWYQAAGDEYFWSGGAFPI